MAFDPHILLDHPPIISRYTVKPTKIMLYALGVGADELPFVYEDGLKVLPTMAVVITYPGFVWRDPALQVNWQKILHAETSVVLHQPLPTSGELIGSTTFGPIFDKGAGKGAMVYQTREIHTPDGQHVATVRNTTFLRGDGGFGGASEGQPAPHPLPEGAPDLVETIATPANLAMIYRLSGDFNPLHIDPASAQAVGFDRPILHGLATYGVAGRALVRGLTGNEPDRIKRIDARFSSPVYPGETIETSIWHEAPGENGNRRAAFRCRVVERDVVVLNNGYVEYS